MTRRKPNRASGASESLGSKSTLFSEETELRRELGFSEALAIVINRIIGSGIFRTPGPIMLLVGSVSLFYGVWVLGALVTLLGAFCYAELVAMMPRSGGPYVYLKAAYPPVVTFLRGWAMFFVSETGAIAAVSLFFAESATSLMSTTHSTTGSRLLELGIALVVIWGLTAANSFGIRASGILQNVFLAAKMAAIGLVLVAGFSRRLEPAHFTTDWMPREWSWSTFLAVGAAMRYAFFAYSGWEGATYVAGEVKDPRATLPRSLFFGIGAVMIVYLAANSAYLNVIPAEGIAESKIIAVDVMKKAVGPAGALLVALALMINAFGNVNTQILAKSRTWYAMARDGLFFRRLAALHPVSRTPVTAMLVQGAWATVLLLFAILSDRAYETVIDFFSFTSAVFNVLTFAAVWVLRRKLPGARRPFRLWGFPYVLIIVLLIQAYFMVTTLITAFVPSMIGVGLTLTGLIYYRWRVVPPADGPPKSAEGEIGG